MKKFIAIIVVILLFINLCSCNKINNNDGTNDMLYQDYMSMIYECADGVADTFNHNNTISSKVEHFFDDNAELEKEKNLKINGADAKLEYLETIYYPIGDKKLNRYIVDGNEKNTVLINQDGKVEALHYKFVFLDISKNALPSDVLLPLEKEIAQLVNISEYEYVYMPEAANEVSEGFGVYDYLYYNRIDGYITDYFNVAVSDDGGVFGLWINNLTYDGLPDDINIDKELEKKLLNQKLGDIYNTDETIYTSYNTTIMPPQIVCYNDLFFVQHSITANYIHLKNGENTSHVKTILIPIDLIVKI